LTADARFLRDAVVEAGFRQMVFIPLLSGETLMGVMSVAGRSADAIDERSVQLLAAVGTWAGLAIENARLHQDARRLAVLEERERIGMDLHDGIIQSIYGVGLSLESAHQDMQEGPAGVKDRVRLAIEALSQAIRDIRAYILDLRPRQLGNDGLVGGLKRLVLEYRANTFSEVSLTTTDADVRELPHSHALALFHICQEALANAAKHAKARKAEVSVWTTADRVLMEVRDDGKGFEMEKMTTTIGHGLANMQTRGRAAGGDVDISSIIGEGTTILAWVPRTLT
jgi:signal transduction histidine kinase